MKPFLVAAGLQILLFGAYLHNYERADRDFLVVFGLLFGLSGWFQAARKARDHKRSLDMYLASLVRRAKEQGRPL